VHGHEIFNMYMLFTHHINIWDETRTDNCVLLGCHAVSSYDSLQKFRDNISVPSSRLKNPPPKNQFSQCGVYIWNSMGGDKFSLAWRSIKNITFVVYMSVSFTLLYDKSVSSGGWLSDFGVLYWQHIQNTT
jgi:hypothetical protein